jgi:hypothetical protein
LRAGLVLSTELLRASAPELLGGTVLIRPRDDLKIRLQKTRAESTIQMLSSS